jgi:hypothetical protein
MVGYLCGAYAKNLGDPGWEDFIAELCSESENFAALWPEMIWLFRRAGPSRSAIWDKDRAAGAPIDWQARVDRWQRRLETVPLRRRVMEHPVPEHCPRRGGQSAGTAGDLAHRIHDCHPTEVKALQSDIFQIGRFVQVVS